MPTLLPAPPLPADTALRRRRGFSDVAGLAPQLLRELVRGDEIWLTVLAALLGGAAGLLVVAMNQASQLAHEMLYGLPPGQRLSAQGSLAAWRALTVPCVGGLCMGGLAFALARWRPARTVDPIEANALYGGKMSLGDSFGVVAQTLLSNGVGASVGLEAGYTQIGAAVASRVGRIFRVRRADLRLLVGCGAAGAIASAFNAPLTGAFYAFELVIGTYALGSLAPVVSAAISAVMIQRVFLGDEPGYGVSLPGDLATEEFLPVLALGAWSARWWGSRSCIRSRSPNSCLRAAGCRYGCGRRSADWCWARMALRTPAILSAGHGALRIGLTASLPLGGLLLLLALKAAASAISLGSGFRGGTVLCLALSRRAAGQGIRGRDAADLANPGVFPTASTGMIGMSGMAVAIVGAVRLTMTFSGA